MLRVTLYGSQISLSGPSRRRLVKGVKPVLLGAVPQSKSDPVSNDWGVHARSVVRLLFSSQALPKPDPRPATVFLNEVDTSGLKSLSYFATSLIAPTHESIVCLKPLDRWN